jgi:hypothetical protein
MSSEAEASECLASDRERAVARCLAGAGERERETEHGVGLPVNAPSQEREQ